MARDRLIPKRVNIYDGQRITEADLDAEQIHKNTIVSDVVIDFHGSGVVNDTPFETRVLLDTRAPGTYTEGDTENPTKVDIEAGTYDGKGIYVDRQPSDSVRGNRIEFELVNANVKGRKRTKLMVLGRAFDGSSTSGELVAEFIEFAENTRKVSKHYYIEVISILFNNFSGGTGRTENVASADSLDLISAGGGYLVVRETEPLEVFPATESVTQTESPNIDMINFITSATNRSITDEITLALGATNTISDLYVDLVGKEEITFPSDGATSIAYGQKFLSETNNIQKIDLLLSVERDTSRPADSQFDFSGDLVLSIYELVSEVSCSTDAVPDDLIDFDPEITPIIETSLNQTDIEALGYELTDVPQIVSFNFAGTLLADPNIEPSIEDNKFYSFIVTRRGDNRTGTVILEKGYDKVTKKGDDGIPLTNLENFGKRTTKYIEFDPITKRYINDSSSSLWFKVYSDTVEITDGTAYTDNGRAVTIPKTVEFVGNSEISNFERNIPIRTVAEDSNNYVVFSHVEEFSDPGTHPRTGNFVFTRIIDGATISVVNDDELTDIQEDTTPLLLARVNDSNTRDAEVLSGSFDKPGYIGTETVLLFDPGADVLNSNLINRIITPDTGCNCNANYRIVGVNCITLRPGDFDDDGNYTLSDVGVLLDLVGNTINSEATERSILGGEIDILDFLRGDLDANDTIDGIDIELLEDAIDGYVNFSVEQEIKVLELQLENVLESSNNPTIFTDAASSGATTASTDTITFTTVTDSQALIIRPGDQIEIAAGSLDAGTYKIDSKTVASDGLSVTVTVTDLDDASVTFTGDTGFNVTIVSGTEVNALADNQLLAGIPFAATNYEITFIDAPFESQFVDVCDLRRFIGSSFLASDEKDPCECDEDECLPVSECAPKHKNQTVVPGDLYLANGNVLSAPGVPHPLDFEYSTITIPLPPGSIEDCSINLYDAFIKGESGGCTTAAGYPAMKYSDGTIVGCQDSGTNTDIAKGRVKFSSAVASINVDALVDGYAQDDEEAEATSTTTTSEAIDESFVDYSYTTFNTWTENAGNNATITNISHPSGVNQPAIFDLTTASDSGERFGRLDSPLEAQQFKDDFIIDFRAARTTWQDTLIITGEVSSFATIVISNDDGSTATLKLGWKVVGGYTTQMFYSGVIEDALSTVLSTFEFTIDTPDELGDEVLFRFRRVNDVVFAYYIIPGKISESTVDSFGHYVRIGSNPEMQPGAGPADFSFEIAQNSSPTPGAIFFTRLSEVIMMSEYTSDDTVSSLTFSRDAATNQTNRATITLPFNLTRRTTVNSATLTFTSETSATITDSFNIIPIDMLNADNLGAIHNVPLEEFAALIGSFTPGTITSGGTIEIDITSQVISLMSQQGHLPGFIKGFVIEPDITANSSFSISSLVTLAIVYVDESTGTIFKVGVSIDTTTGIASFNTRNILYDALVDENRTTIQFGVYLKKAGFANQDVAIGIADLDRLGIGSCSDAATFEPEEECFFIAGETAPGTFVEGPFPCQFHLP
jgi:hypothetical protein